MANNTAKAAMKPLLFLLGILLCLSPISCAVQKQYTIGMSETQFKKENPNADLAQAVANVTVYRIDKASWPRSKFFYFKNGVLAIIDEGQRSPDIVVQLSKE